MDSFPFTLSLNFKMEIVTIKPPMNFTILSEAICEKYDLNRAYLFYNNEEGIELEIKNDSDYMEFLDYATQQNINEIEIYIRSDEQMSQHRKLSLRKRSSMRQSGDNTAQLKPKILNKNGVKELDNESNDDDDDFELGIQCDYDYYGDTRNRKGMTDEGYTNQNLGFKERKRIYYIKQKKDMQREHQIEEENENDDKEESSEEEEHQHKRKLKNQKKKKEEIVEVEKKPKKQSKKGRIMIKGGGYRGGH